MLKIESMLPRLLAVVDEHCTSAVEPSQFQERLKQLLEALDCLKRPFCGNADCQALKQRLFLLTPKGKKKSLDVRGAACRFHAIAYKIMVDRVSTLAWRTFFQLHPPLRWNPLLSRLPQAPLAVPEDPQQLLLCWLEATCALLQASDATWPGQWVERFVALEEKCKALQQPNSLFRPLSIMLRDQPLLSALLIQAGVPVAALTHPFFVQRMQRLQAEIPTLLALHLSSQEPIMKQLMEAPEEALEYLLTNLREGVARLAPWQKRFPGAMRWLFKHEFSLAQLFFLSDHQLEALLSGFLEIKKWRQIVVKWQKEKLFTVDGSVINLKGPLVCALLLPAIYKNYLLFSPYLEALCINADRLQQLVQDELKTPVQWQIHPPVSPTILCVALKNFESFQRLYKALRLSPAMVLGEAPAQTNFEVILRASESQKQLEWMQKHWEGLQTLSFSRLTQALAAVAREEEVEIQRNPPPTFFRPIPLESMPVVRTEARRLRTPLPEGGVSFRPFKREGSIM